VRGENPKLLEKIMAYHKTVLLAAICAGLPSFVLADSIDPVVAAYHKMQTAHFRAGMTMTDSKGKVTKGSSEYEGMERIHMNIDGQEMILLPGVTWMRTDGQWTKSPIDMSAMVKRMEPMGEEMLHNAKNVRDEGLTTFNGRTAHAYSMDVDMSMLGIRSTSHNKVYLNSTGQLIGMESNGEAMGHTSHAVQSITYDDSIRVQAPAGS
jgi:hypothetical protein